jgi:hypothetical protein
MTTIRAAGFIASLLAAASLQGAQPPGAPGAVDLASVELGGRVEWATSQAQSDTAPDNLIATTRNYGWMSGTTTFPQDIVFSFFSRQPALVAGVEINPASEAGLGAAKDVEVWLSSESPTDGFTKVGEASLKNENALQAIDVPPTEATYVKVRVLSSYVPPGRQNTLLRRVRVLEGARAGYVPMLERHPALAALARGEIPIAPADAGGPPPPPGGRDTCQAPPRAGKARFPQSRNVLLVEGTQGIHRPYVRDGNKRALDQAATPGVSLRMILPDALAPALLIAEPRIDTIVLAQVCDIARRVPKEFKQALMAWVAAGHKLIIQDSDACRQSPDYSFLPYPLKTANPGSAGARGVAGILEDSTLVSANPDDDAYLDMKRWNDGPNDLGDSNVVIEWDAHWCGAMWARNKLQKSGFALAYAHFGRGLIIYDGVDYDQAATAPYRELVAQELLQPFDPDGLTCSNPLGGFTISTDNRLKSQYMTPGQAYAYPLEVLGNFGYSGKVTLEARVVPADPGVSVALQNGIADLSATDEAKASLTVTASPTATLKSKVIAITGRDQAGKSNVLCLNLNERTTGGLTVLSGINRDKPPTKNLEIILDASGSMKAMLGRKTRWATAQEVLKDVVSKLPKDFSVGLRAYGHTLPSTSPKTCTDTSLVVPVAPLNPAALIAAASKLVPRGETPLVYSILQTPGDLKAVKGGTVILITDGEESCKGDFAAAAKALKESGLDLTLNIVGFTLKSAAAQTQLSGLAESTGGRYYSAQSGAALSRALLLAAVDRLPYRVLDAAGGEVATGVASATRPHELPPGSYTLVVAAGEETLQAPVTVAVRQDQSVTVVVKDDKLAVEN